LVKRNEILNRRRTYLSQGTDVANHSSKVNSGTNVKMPGGAGNIPDDLNFEVFGNAILEMNNDDEDDDDMFPIIEDLSKASYNIYALQNKKLLF